MKHFSAFLDIRRRKGQPSILAWKMSWTEEAGGLQLMRSQRVGHNWATEDRYNWGDTKIRLITSTPENIYLKNRSASPPTTRKNRVPKFCSPPWAPFRECWKPAAAAVHDLIPVEGDSKHPGQAPLCSWLHILAPGRGSLGPWWLPIVSLHHLLCILGSQYLNPKHHYWSILTQAFLPQTFSVPNWL